MSFLNNFSLEGKIALVTGASYYTGYVVEIRIHSDKKT